MGSKQGRGGRSQRVRRAAESSFQPASERDLQRFEPLTGECRRIRAMLRDYCDDELTTFLQSEVDEHVHGCRDCGLALSRHELEVLRLRNAFQDERNQIENAPKELTRAVMARVEDLDISSADRSSADRSSATEDAGDSSLQGDAEAPVPQGFTGRVMDRVQMEWRPSHPHERALAIMRKGLFLVPIAAVCLVAALFWSSLLTGPELAPAYRLESMAGGTVSVRAEDGSWQEVLNQRALDQRELNPQGSDSAAGESSLALGSVLPVGSRLDVGPMGSASIRLANEGGVALLRAELEANTSIQLAAEHLQVGRGALAIEGAVRVQVAELCALHLLESPPGSEVRSHLSLAEVQRPDHALESEKPLRLRLEVQAGKAEIWRAGERLQTIYSGQVAEFDDWSEIRVEPALTADLLNRSRQNGLRPSRDPFQSMSASWRGNLRGALSGEGLFGVEVELSSSEVQVTLKTASDGSFIVPEGLLRGGLAVLRVRSQDSTLGYASYGPEPIDLTHLQAGQLPVIELPVDRPVSGLLRSLDRGSLGAARILPVVVDELFQLAETLEECATQTDAEGRFVLRGLPVDLPAHQRLSLLVEHADYPNRAFLELGRRERGQQRTGLDLVMEPGREVRLYGLPPGEQVEVFAALAGMPRRALARRHDMQADSEGSVVMHEAGSGPFWYLDSANDRLVELALSADQEGFSLPIPDSSPLGHRYARLGGETEISSADSFVHVVMQDGQQSVVVPGARLFLSIGSSRPRYLGSYDGFSDLQFKAPRDLSYSLFGVSANGVGTLSSAMLPDPDLEAMAALRLQSAGSLVLTEGAATDGATQPGLQAPMLLRFLRIDGILAGNSYWRLVSAQDDWRAEQLPAGRYRIMGPAGHMAECRIESGEETEIAYVRRR